MFVSDSWAEVKGLAALLEPGQRGWHVMLKPQMSPWFHATVVTCDEGFDTRTTVFIDSLSSLITWIESGQEGMLLESLQLVSPGWLRGGKGWEMNALAEIAQNQLEGAVRFTLQDGRIYYYPDPAARSTHGFEEVLYRLHSEH
ncbi:hypothetical protein F9Z43_06595 [Pseudomonas monteilii]|uniref:Uncharacterized protein n=1 Tax=Pseudomonas monteilii TaxID=76759 RepID=A0A7X3F0E5_9PSED|nr:hypothetical protein [Pseudomonas monteilii]MVF49004.1 hypothetical protein [Pseudomonas monteilii]